MWTAVVVNVPLSARRVLVSGEGMNVGCRVEINSFAFFVAENSGPEDGS